MRALRVTVRPRAHTGVRARSSPCFRPIPLHHLTHERFREDHQRRPAHTRSRSPRTQHRRTLRRLPRGRTPPPLPRSAPQPLHRRPPRLGRIAGSPAPPRPPRRRRAQTIRNPRGALSRLRPPRPRTTRLHRRRQPRDHPQSRRAPITRRHFRPLSRASWERPDSGGEGYWLRSAFYSRLCFGSSHSPPCHASERSSEACFPASTSRRSSLSPVPSRSARDSPTPIVILCAWRTRSSTPPAQ